MGNVNPKYQIKSKALNALSEDVWASLRAKWKTIPDEALNVTLFTNIILLSYETIVSIALNVTISL